jgi:hypothetical protein
MHLLFPHQTHAASLSYSPNLNLLITHDYLVYIIIKLVVINTSFYL